MALSPLFGGQTAGIDTGGDGVPVVLLHAYPLSPEMWQPQAAALAGAARIIAPAAPGFAGSPLDPAGWTVNGYADQLAEWLDRAGVGPVILGGLSMGGYVALAFVRRHPNRLRGLILADTKAEPDTAEAKANRDKSAAFARENGAVAVIDSMLPKMLSERTRQHRPDAVAAVKRIASEQSIEAIVAALKALRDRPDASSGLSAIRVPTLVIVGANDELTPPAAARTMAAAISGSTLVEIPTAGHLSNLEAPAEFNAAVRSLVQKILQ